MTNEQRRIEQHRIISNILEVILHTLLAIGLGVGVAVLCLAYLHGQQPPNITGAPLPAGSQQTQQHYEPLAGGRYQGGILVWANPKSGIYHCHFYKNGKPNPHYGTVQGGKEITLDQAHAAGYRPSHHSECSQ